MQELRRQEIRRREIERLEDPPVEKSLFGDVSWSWLWLILRVYLGYEWLAAGLEKFGNPAWIEANAGAAVTGFVQGALGRTTGEHPDVQGWYAWFLENMEARSDLPAGERCRG